MIKCIASDMDGTLLNGDHLVSEENKRAILAAKQQGIEVVIATGRSYNEANYVLADAGLNLPIICANGAEVRSPQGELLATNPIDHSKVIEIMNVLTENDVYFELYTSVGTFSTDYDRAISIIMDIYMSNSLKGNYEKSLEAAKERFSNGLIQLVDSYEELLKDDSIQINKVIAFSFQEETLEQTRERLKQLTGIAVSSSGKENIEINSTSAQKGNALTTFVKDRGLKLEETMALGDNYNDLSMFKVVGRAVAMGNASEEIKKQCHFVTDSNISDGVAKAIWEILK